MAHVLVAIPSNPRHPEALRAQAHMLAARLPEANPDHTLDIQIVDTPIEVPTDSPIYTRHATIRNHVIDTRLRGHEWVLWIDSDLCDYPADLPTTLLQHGCIAAPMVTLDHHGERFYDIGGFIEHGRRARMGPPWFDQAGPVIELESVGCCYVIPAWLYRVGIRYAPPPYRLTTQDQHGTVGAYVVEHWSVMRQAAARGVRIVALTDVRAVHAWLPDYGIEPN